MQVYAFSIRKISIGRDDRDTDRSSSHFVDHDLVVRRNARGTTKYVVVAASRFRERS